jgi:hypothetical protein
MDGGPADLGAKLVMARERRDTTTGLRDAFILYDKSTDCYHLAVYLISRCSPPLAAPPENPVVPHILIYTPHPPIPPRQTTYPGYMYLSAGTAIHSKYLVYPAKGHFSFAMLATRSTR